MLWKVPRGEVESSTLTWRLAFSFLPVFLNEGEGLGRPEMFGVRGKKVAPLTILIRSLEEKWNGSK